MTLRSPTHLLAAGLLAAVAAWPGSVHAQAPVAPEAPAAFVAGLSVVEGQDYTVLQTPGPQAADKVDVVFFYRYTERLSAPAMALWGQWASDGNPYLTLASYPVIFHDLDGFGARVFFALTELKQEARLSPSLVAAIHGPRPTVASADPATWTAWLAQQGVDGGQFETVINSPQVIAMTTGVPQTMALYGVTQSPTIVVDGRYVFTPSAQNPPDVMVRKAHALVDRLLLAQAQGGLAATGAAP